ATIKRDPYRFFFPVGIFWGVYGVLLWILAFLEVGDTFPFVHHGYVMFGGFFLSFVLGFLYTAIPQFTKSAFMSNIELFLATSLQFFLIAFGVLNQEKYFFITLALQFVCLFVFIIKRFVRRTENPPDSFVFLPIGLIVGLVASLMFAFDGNGIVARLLLYDAMILFLVIGVGSRLIPGIFGWVDIVAPMRARYENATSFGQAISPSVITALSFLVASYFLEAYEHSSFAHTIRAVIVLFVSIRYWKIYKFPKNRTPHTTAIWMSIWMLLIGTVLYIFYPNIHIQHISYIGGYGLMTLMVAARVVLAHSGEGLAAESKIFPYRWIWITVLILALSRGALNLYPEAYMRHALYYAIIWILLLSCWCYCFIPKMVKQK
ncbi:MAG: NnrS family protein, partial [Streptococcus sp.]|nr:NnrS family protein [Streptococcus sp.]